MKDGRKLTYAELGRGIGISKQAVSSLVKKGMPIESVAAAKRWRKANLQHASTKQARPDASGRTGGASTSAYSVARAAREQVRLEREKIELERIRGTLIDFAEAARAAGTCFRVIRDGIENVPPRIAARLAAESDPFTVQAILAEELRAVLSSFRLEEAVREQPDEEGDDDGKE